MTTLAVSDSDLLALSILGVACCALAVLIGGLFWIMLKNGKKAKEQEDLFRGLEGIFDDDPERNKTGKRTLIGGRSDFTMFSGS